MEGPRSSRLSARCCRRSRLCRLCPAFSTASANSTGEDTGPLVSGYLEDAHRKRRAFFKSVRRHLVRPRPSYRRDRQPHSPRRPASCSTRSRTGKADARRARCSAPRCSPKWPRMSIDDGLVLQIHPGAWRNHSPTVPPKFGRDKGFDIPTAHRLCRRAEAAARCRRHRPAPVDYPLHPRRDRLFARARPARRRLSIAETRPALVVPRQPRGHAALPRDGHRDAPASTTPCRLQRRHPRLPRSRPATMSARRVDCAFLARLVTEHRLEEEEAPRSRPETSPTTCAKGRPTSF